MNLYTACSIVEGFDGWEHDESDPDAGDKRREQIKDAWQHLIDTGAAWTLQGWYGRSAAALIEQGICKEAK